ncbi:MAG TPA: hypothetical protein ENG45_00770 [Candidatus Aenigmarchaeota archaeon]|nr:hypothetical protein [Candidatus Aenigmarchaeota archaeon]
MLILTELLLNGYYLCVTNLLESLSRRYKIPLSTLKWNARKLRKLGLIDAGDKSCKGKVTRLTPLGKKLAEVVVR